MCMIGVIAVLFGVHVLCEFRNVATDANIDETISTHQQLRNEEMMREVDRRQRNAINLKLAKAREGSRKKGQTKEEGIRMLFADPEISGRYGGMNSNLTDMARGEPDMDIYT